MAPSPAMRVRVSRSPLCLSLTLCLVLLAQAQAELSLAGQSQLGALSRTRVSSEVATSAPARKLLADPGYKEKVEAAVARVFNYLTVLDTPDRSNPLVTLDVSCERDQLNEGPYLLTGKFIFTPEPDLPVPARRCTFLPGKPILVVVGDVLCTPLCSADAQKCDCCDGSGATTDNTTNVCPFVNSGTDCSNCLDVVSLNYLDVLDDPNSKVTLTDLSTGVVTPIDYAFVAVEGPYAPLPPHSYFKTPNAAYSYGPDSVSTGPRVHVGQFALIDPTLLRPGRSYRVATTFALYNNGNPVVYDVTIAAAEPCDVSGAAPNACFNGDGSASVCCPGQCRSPPLANNLPACAEADVPGTPTPGASTTCDPSFPLPNQCFNADGSSFVCCPGGCGPGPNAVCA